MVAGTVAASKSDNPTISVPSMIRSRNGTGTLRSTVSLPLKRTALVVFEAGQGRTDRAGKDAGHGDFWDLIRTAKRHGFAVVRAHISSEDDGSQTAHGADQGLQDGELCFALPTQSAFLYTGLDAFLQDLDVSHVVLAGTDEGGHVTSTASDAQNRGYCICSLENPLHKRPPTANVLPAEELIGQLRTLPLAERPKASDRLGRLWPALGASFPDTTLWTHSKTHEALRSEAKRIDDLGASAGPLAGLFFSVKEMIDVAAWTTTAMQTRPGIKPEPRQQSAHVVRRLEAAGAILVGKNTMDLFATGIAGVRCPVGHPACAGDPSRVPGGSSSGCAVAVARGLVDFSIGTDTAGSVRMPAALNGIIGHKPSVGALSTQGIIGCQPLLDCVGIFAREAPLVRDVWIIVRGHDASDIRSDAASDGPRPMHRFSHQRVGRLSKSTTGQRKLVIAVPPLSLIDKKCEAVYAEQFRGAIVCAEACGASIRYLTMGDIGPYLRAGELVYGGLVAERYACLAPYLTRQEDWNALVPSTRSFLERASNISIVEYTSALHERLALQRAMRAFWCSGPAGIDALMVPTATDHATIAEATASLEGDLCVNARIGTFTYAANVLDLCGVAVPAKPVPRDDGSGLDRPFGITFVAPKYDDGFLLHLAEVFLQQQTH